MELGHPAAVHRRDRALNLMNDLTVAVAIAATGLLGMFAIIAAATIPGHSGGTALAATGSGSTEAGGDTSGGTSGGTSSWFPNLQQPGDGSVSQGGSTAPVAVSGGSR